MELMAEDFFGEQAAERYDSAVGDIFAAEVVEPTVTVLTELAGEGAAWNWGLEPVVSRCR